MQSAKCKMKELRCNYNVSPDKGSREQAPINSTTNYNSHIFRHLLHIHSRIIDNIHKKFF